MIYDFSQLNDKEFENLAIDLLSSHFNVRFERFKPGKDKGVDGRFFSNDEQEDILQCKHYLKSGYKSLISKLKSEEVKKVIKLQPNKYIFITSIPLSRDNKKEIRKIFTPYIHLDNDIFGQEDLNDLLSINPKIEEKNFKLWISSTTVFNRIINNAIKGRSEFEIEQIKIKSKKYVHTTNHDEAINILNKNNVLIISGEPGIGKTILAENLCLYYLSKDYEFIDIEESLSEAESVYKRGEKQLFYFDDFLGSNYFEAIENKKDSHIMKFIARVKSDKTKIFILTTRTNILNSGIVHSSVFSVNKIRNNEFLLTIEKINEFDKAKILYNHIWFSNLSEDYIDEIYKEKRYKKIINHKNFNPRLIEFITDSDRITIQALDYWNYINSTLENPKDIWSDCFKIQNNAFVRNLVILTVFNGSNILEEELRLAYDEIINLEDIKNISNTEKDFNLINQLAVKSFLNRNKTEKEKSYSLFNPSIADFILNEYKNDIKKLTNVFKALYSVNSIEQLISLEKSNIISSDAAFNILEEMFNYAFEIDKNYDYLLYISDLFKNDKKKKDKIIFLLNKILNIPDELKEFSKLLNLLVIFKSDLIIKNFGFLLHTIQSRYLDINEINSLTSFLDNYEIKDQNILNEIKEEIEIYIHDLSNDIATDMDLSDYIDYYTDHDGSEDINVHEDAIKENIREELVNYIGDFDSTLISELNIDIYDITSQVNIDDAVDAYFKSIQYEPDDYEGYGGGSYGYDNAIDDLFDRS